MAEPIIVQTSGIKFSGHVQTVSSTVIAAQGEPDLRAEIRHVSKKAFLADLHKATGLVKK